MFVTHCTAYICKHLEIIRNFLIANWHPLQILVVVSLSETDVSSLFLSCLNIFVSLHYSLAEQTQEEETQQKTTVLFICLALDYLHFRVFRVSEQQQYLT